MRRIDLHCYPGTAEWIASQQPFPEALARYWNKPWEPRDEDEVVAGLQAHGIEAMLVAFDIESVTGAPPCGNAYVSRLRARHPETFVGCWGAVDPGQGEQAIGEARSAVREHGVTGFHFHPIMGRFSVDDPLLRPLFEEIAGLGVPVMIDVGTTGMGAGLPVGTVRLGTPVLSGAAAHRHPRAAPGQDHVRHRPPQHPARAAPARVG
jgi:predicted TIM-barrel fold metal-dependent hydrolase